MIGSAQMTKTAKPTTTTSDVDPATLAHQELLKRQRQNAQRALLKRRQKKSGQ